MNKINRPHLSIVTIIALSISVNLFAPPTYAQGQDTRPNILLILADDLGYSDLGCYGSEIETPNIDKLAKNGLRFSQFYNTSRCCPSRAALLTGVYNHDAGIGEMTTKRAEPGYQGHITENTVTLAEVLKQAGYQTAMVGKWHVSNTIEQKDSEEQLKWLNHQVHYPLFSPIEQYPTRRGFDKFYGTIWGVVDYFDPFSLVNGEEAVQEVPSNYYHTDALNDTAAHYIKSLVQGDQPFFLYLAHNAPHWPLQALPEDIAKYEKTYQVGWYAIRKQRYERMVALGLIDPKQTPLSQALKADENWESNPSKAWDAHAMAVHAAMVDRMDQGIGRVIKALEESGALANTLILFLSDNGASPENCAAFGPGFDRPGETRDGKPISYPVNKDVLPGPQTTYASIGAKWANVANTPYREAKAQSYEGGVRTPLIAYWPEGLKAPKGSISKQVGHVMDFMATFIDLAAAKYPTTYKGHEIVAAEGLSLVPSLQGQSAVGHQELFNEHYNAKYVRQGDWKLVAKPNGQWHLYHLVEDGSENHDLAATYPDKVKELETKWNIWAKAHHVYPKPGK
ncbi:arylsulfatase [Olivibacter ginsenosidimutans]|uniref:Arylsulfatase n=1 Tax=Olivibacter ginsenosidimutans TaxID=1176537 RepID=A0ABP9BW91_9SPHI